MNHGRPTAAKRDKEKSRKEHQKQKDVRRSQRKEDRANRPAAANGEDPDIAGIVPGPQKPPEDF
jgi:hypothetical protein